MSDYPRSIYYPRVTTLMYTRVVRIRVTTLMYTRVVRIRVTTLGGLDVCGCVHKGHWLTVYRNDHIRAAKKGSWDLWSVDTTNRPLMCDGVEYSNSYLTISTTFLSSCGMTERCLGLPNRAWDQNWVFPIVLQSNFNDVWNIIGHGILSISVTYICMVRSVQHYNVGLCVHVRQMLFVAHVLVYLHVDF